MNDGQLQNRTPKATELTMMTPAGEVAPKRAKIRMEIPKVHVVRVEKGPT